MSYKRISKTSNPKKSKKPSQQTIVVKPIKPTSYPLMTESELIKMIEKEDYEDDVFFEIDNKITSNNGWISPNGKFFNIRWQEHNDTGEFIASHLFGEESSARLELEGWIKLSKNVVLVVKDKTKSFHPKIITDKHKDMIYDYMIKNNKDAIDFALITKNIDGTYDREHKTIVRKDLYTKFW